jgi:hypothetical protein
MSPFLGISRHISEVPLDIPNGSSSSNKISSEQLIVSNNGSSGNSEGNNPGGPNQMNND